MVLGIVHGRWIHPPPSPVVVLGTGRTTPMTITQSLSPITAKLQPEGEGGGQPAEDDDEEDALQVVQAEGDDVPASSLPHLPALLQHPLPPQLPLPGTSRETNSYQTRIYCQLPLIIIHYIYDDAFSSLK